MRVVNIILTLSLLLLVCLCRHRVDYPFMLDTLITVLLVASYRIVRLPRMLTAALSFVGRHSANVFLFHTFIYFYYFPELIYWSRNPLLIYLTLLSVCLVISIGIERLKRLVGLPRLVDWAAG